jgi:intracellular multiplication protein IcmK
MTRKTRLVAVLALISGLAPFESFAQDANPLLLPPANYPATASNAAAGGQIAIAPAAPADPDAAFKEALKGVVPLTDDQVKKLRIELDKIDKAQGQPLTAVKPSTRSIQVSLRSGEYPAVINTSPGWISTITFSDVTGQPWPVLSVTNGNPDAYNIQSSGPEGSTNIITISSKQGYVPSNIAVTLVGAKVPILMTLQPTDKGQVDFRVDALMDQRGPNAAYDIISNETLAPTDDSIMLAFLDGVPPSGAKPLKTTSRDVQAWRYNDLTYIRTDKALMSPAPIRKTSNASRTNVWVINEIPVVMFSDRDTGRTEYVNINRR